MSTPYYLQRNEQVETTAEIGKFDLFDFTPLEQKYDSTSTSMFESFGSSFDQAGDYVWSSIDNAWVSTKNAVNEGIASLGSAAGDIYSFVKTEVLIWAGAILIVIWIIAKSDVLPQAARIMESM